MSQYTRDHAIAATAAQHAAAMQELTEDHFTLDEFYVHEIPPDAVISDKLPAVAALCEWFRSEIVQGPVYVKSYFRSLDHNAEVGGAQRSGHLTGDAADLEPGTQISFDEIAQRVLSALANGTAPAFGQMILYQDQGHIHITSAGVPNGDRRVMLVSPDKSEDQPRSYIAFDTIAGFRRVFGSPGGQAAVALILFFFSFSSTWQMTNAAR